MIYKQGNLNLMMHICHGISHKYIVVIPLSMLFHVEEETVEILNRSWEGTVADIYEKMKPAQYKG